MTDSLTDNLFNRSAPITSLCSLPSEMLSSILSYSNLFSLIKISATCSSIRYHVHEIFTYRISAQAAKYPEVKQSLDRLGWKKKHNSWDCKCFRMIAGPVFTWSHLQEHRRFSVVIDPSLVRKIATVAGKSFLMPSGSEISYGQMTPDGNVGHNSLHTLVKFNNLAWNVNLASFDNVLAVVFKSFIPRRSIMAYVFNATSLAKVSEASVCHDENGVSVDIRSVVLTRDTMVVHLYYFCRNQIHDQIERDTKIQIWKINTKDPEEGEPTLVRIISHNTASLSRHIHPSNIAINDGFIAIFDVVVKVFGRTEENPIISQIDIADKTLKEVAIQGGQGDHLALLLKYVNADNVLKLAVNVYSASRGELIVVKEFNAIMSYNSPFYMKWFGDHLTIASQDGNTLSMFSWQSGFTSFLSSPIQLPVVRRSPRGNGEHNNTMWIASCIQLDFQGLKTSVYNEFGDFDSFFEKLVYYKTWNCP